MTGEWVLCFVLLIGLVAFGIKRNFYVAEKPPKDETYQVCKSTDTTDKLKEVKQ